MHMVNTKPLKLLLVEDDARLRQELDLALTEEGFRLLSVSTLADAHSALAHPLDLVLLDLGLPDGDGLDLCHHLHQHFPNLPVLILTARDEPSARVRGLEVGADDYVTKPFHLPELVARIRSVLRRSAGIDSQQRLNAGELWLDLQSRTAGRGEAQFALKPREFDLLQFLLQHKGRAWTRPQLLNRVWGPAFIGTDRTVDVHVGRLRNEIEPDPRDPTFIQTVWGVGYRLVDPQA